MPTTYKKDQGRMVRMAAFWLFALLMLFGATSFHSTLLGFDSLQEAFFVVPIVGVNFNIAFISSTAILAAGLYLLHRWQQTPKVADLLVETEGELRKVTWPSFQEVVDSSIVVVICVLVIMGFLALADILIPRLVSPIHGALPRLLHSLMDTLGL